MRIAFFGGSFDPPHCGHLAVARAAQRALALDKVLFAPVALQPLKPSGASASFEDRVAMTELAIAGKPNFEVSLADAPEASDSDLPNYTIDTLTRLRAKLPADAHLFLLLGADSLITLPHWHRAAEILFLADLIVASRPDQDLSDLSACMPAGITLTREPDNQSSGNQYRLENGRGQRAHLTILPDLQYEVSATQVRESIRDDGKDSAPSIPEAVLQYIERHQLYK
jgi:nicotinate-nucleotide adenylyltransferase